MPGVVQALSGPYATSQTEPHHPRLCRDLAWEFWTGTGYQSVVVEPAPRPAFVAPKSRKELDQVERIASPNGMTVAEEKAAGLPNFRLYPENGFSR
jgi:hypothetical protein